MGNGEYGAGREKNPLLITVKLFNATVKESCIDE